MFPNDLLVAYVELVKNEPEVATASQHLLSFLEDVKTIAAAVKVAVDAVHAKSGNTSSAQ